MQISTKSSVVINFELTEKFHLAEACSPMERIIPAARPHLETLQEIIPALKKALQLTDALEHVFQDVTHMRVPKKLEGIVGIEDINDNVMKTIGDITADSPLICRDLFTTQQSLPSIKGPIACRHLTFKLV